LWGWGGDGDISHGMGWGWGQDAWGWGGDGDNVTEWAGDGVVSSSLCQSLDSMLMRDKNVEDMITCFDTIHERVRQTDRQTDRQTMHNMARQNLPNRRAKAPVCSVTRACVCVCE